MASAAPRDELSCSICLNLYTELVLLRCGHNLCRECMVAALDTQEGSGVYSCPECREEYEARPTLEKNRKLCNIVDNFRSTQQKEEKSEIFCVYCVDSPVRAVKTCLQCETSMCDKHLTAHNKSMNHVLVEPTSSFSGKKCSIHKRLLEYYCSEHGIGLCASCCLEGTHHRSITGLINDMQLESNFYEQDATDLILDENTANDFVALSDDLRTVSDTDTYQRRPKLPERFTAYGQVMSVQSFSHGRHYWEVEVSGGGYWDVAVCYPSIKRDGDKSGIGYNKKSWSFRLCDKKYQLLHDSQIQTLRPESPVQRLGIYLDYEKGRLSFYQLCDPIRHLHTFTTTFTEPLHAAFFVIGGAWVKIISPRFSVRL